MKNNFISFIAKKPFIPPLLLLLFIAPLYLYKLESIPTNVTGDENTYLTDVYRILFGGRMISPAELMGDGTQPAINFYLMSLLITLLGFNNTILAMRLTAVIFSLATICVFYVLLKKYTTSLISFFIAILLATSVWYTNLSRFGNGLFTHGALLLGMLMIYFLEKGLKENKLKLFIFAGFFSGLCFYSYFIAKVYPLAAFIYLSFYLIFYKPSLQKIKAYVVFNFILALTILPLIFSVFDNKAFYFLRPSSVFILNNLSPIHNSATGVLLSQSVDVIKGLVLIDGSAIGKGVENLRYFPSATPVVDIIVKMLFFAGLFFSLVLRLNLGIWWIVYLLTLIVVTITIDAPNLSRSIPVLPFIYLLAGIALNELIKITKRKLSLVTVTALLIIIVSLISAYNIRHYFSWIQSSQVAQARQPAIEYEEFSAWQNYQIQRIKNNETPITNYDWYQIRSTIFKTHFKQKEEVLPFK
jgi:hypothetical protein